ETPDRLQVAIPDASWRILAACDHYSSLSAFSLVPLANFPCTCTHHRRCHSHTYRPIERHPTGRRCEAISQPPAAFQPTAWGCVGPEPARDDLVQEVRAASATQPTELALPPGGAELSL